MNLEFLKTWILVTTIFMASVVYSKEKALDNVWYLDHKDEFLETGVTHRVAWRQGMLEVFKELL